MIPLRVSLEGFLSYQEKQIIDFDGSSLWMLWGPNGVGKSAVFDAIIFALFNTHRAGSGVRNARELINHHADRFIIEFDFMVDGIAYRIRRTHARNARPTRGAFILQKNDSKVPVPDTVSEDGLKKWVTCIIGLDYQAFTSSVLLLQGKSDQLLNAESKGRYEILAELIDLSHYQRLHEEAEAHRKEYRGKKETLELQLQSVTVRAISGKEMDAARSDLQRVNEEWQRTQARVRQLAGLLVQAKQWELDTAQLRKQQTELQMMLDVLASKDEITSHFTELQLLRKVLPSLSWVVEQRELILKKKQRITELQNVRQLLEIKLHEAENQQKDVDRRVAQLEQILLDLRGTKEQYSDRLIELSPWVGHLKQIEERQADARGLEIALARFPTDIVQRLEDAEQQAVTLAAKNEALPWLKAFAQVRTDFSQALEGEHSAYVQMGMLQEQLQGLENKHTQLNVKLAEMSNEEIRLSENTMRVGVRHSDAIKRLTNFEIVVMKPICELCGQELTEDHVQREKVRLQKQIEETKQTYEELTELHQRAQEQLRSIQQELAMLDARIKDLTKKYNQSISEQQQARNQANQQAQQLQITYDNIRSPFKDHIITAISIGSVDWLATVYPTSTDLGALQQELVGRDTHESYLIQLREEYNRWQRLDGQGVLIHQQLEYLIKSVDLELAKKAHNEKATIEQKRQALDSEIQQQTQVHQLADKQAEQANDELKKLESQFKQSCSDLEIEKASLSEAERTLQSYVSGLPENWQIQARSLNADGLRVLEQRHSVLTPYEQMLEGLRSARQSGATCEQRIDELNKQIESYPLDACRAAVEVENELEGGKALLSQVDAKRNGVNQQLAKMEKQIEQRRELEEQKRKIDRMSYLYKLLADLLGRSGLQLYLLRRAEKTIVELANKTLSGLSHGRMRLEVRRDSDATATHANKALDLVVYDRDTGRYAIPIGLVSGSQRFRIAVSLALAIGRYTSRESRHIESVIIDEGFGSLDRAGRDDMIQELNSLRQQLARIILVSHQDEFANAFPDRYSFKLVDGASYVSLMEDE